MESDRYGSRYPSSSPPFYHAYIPGSTRFPCAAHASSQATFVTGHPLFFASSPFAVPRAPATTTVTAAEKSSVHVAPNATARAHSRQRCGVAWRSRGTMRVKQSTSWDKMDCRRCRRCCRSTWRESFGWWVRVRGLLGLEDVASRGGGGGGALPAIPGYDGRTDNIR